MKYFSTFSGIGGFELGIKQAYENKNNRKSRKRARVSQCLQYNRDSPNSKRESRENNENFIRQAYDNKTQQRYKEGKKKLDTPQTGLSNNRDINKSFECVAYSEIDKYAIQVYNKQFNHKNYGDITRIRTKELPDFDLLVGGFPCQAFSIAGKRKGFNDTRGTLFFDLARILRDKRPRNFVFENVKGLLSHDSGKTFQTILGVLTDLGYRVEWQVLNSKNFGVPQNRERVFIVGHLREKGGQQIFPIGENDNPFNKANETDKAQSQTKLASTVRTKEGTRSDDNFIMLRDGRDNRSCLRAGRTLEVGIKGHSIRRLTPIECERLQGFPDNWTKKGSLNTDWLTESNDINISDTQRYKMCGNAVVVNVVEAIIGRLLF